MPEELIKTLLDKLSTEELIMACDYLRALADSQEPSDGQPPKEYYISA